MHPNDKVAMAGAGLLLTMATGLGCLILKDAVKEDVTEKFKTEIREKDPARYAKTMEKSGMMNTEESRNFLWENAYKQMHDSLNNLASEAKTNYSKASMNIDSKK